MLQVFETGGFNSKAHGPPESRPVASASYSGIRYGIEIDNSCVYRREKISNMMARINVVNKVIHQEFVFVVSIL